MMNTVALLIGGNQGDRRMLITQATELIRQRIGTVAVASRIYETAPWGSFGEEHPQNFLNQALLVETELTAHEVLEEALLIEAVLGRLRSTGIRIPHSPDTPSPLRGTPPGAVGESVAAGCFPGTGGLSGGLRGGWTRIYHSRPMDIDLVFFNDEVINLPDLQIPHPRAHLRRFVLEPLAEIMPDYRHPVLNLTVEELLRRHNNDIFPAL